MNYANCVVKTMFDSHNYDVDILGRIVKKIIKIINIILLIVLFGVFLSGCSIFNEFGADDTTHYLYSVDPLENVLSNYYLKSPHGTPAWLRGKASGAEPPPEIYYSKRKGFFLEDCYHFLYSGTLVQLKDKRETPKLTRTWNRIFSNLDAQQQIDDVCVVKVFVSEEGLQKALNGDIFWVECKNIYKRGNGPLSERIDSANL